MCVRWSSASGERYFFYCKIIGPKLESNFSQWHRFIVAFKVYVIRLCLVPPSIQPSTFVSAYWNQTVHSTILFSWIRSIWPRAFVHSERIKPNSSSALVKYPNDDEKWKKRGRECGTELKSFVADVYMRIVNQANVASVSQMPNVVCMLSMWERYHLYSRPFWTNSESVRLEPQSFN